MLFDRTFGARFNQFRVADDSGQEVIEIVRHAAGEAPNRFQFLRVSQLFLGMMQRVLGLAKFQDQLRQPSEFMTLLCQRDQAFRVLAFEVAGNEAQGRECRF